MGMSPESFDSQQGIDLALEAFQIGHALGDALDGDVLAGGTIGGQMDRAEGPLAQRWGGRVDGIGRGQCAGFGGGQIELPEGLGPLEGGHLGG